MATGNSLRTFMAANNIPPIWAFLPYDNGDQTEPSQGDLITGDSSGETARIEYIATESGAWPTNAAGYMFVSNLSGVPGDWTTDEFVNTSVFELNTLLSEGFATPETINNLPVLSYDDTINEVSKFHDVLADRYDGGGLTIKIKFSGEDQTGARDVVWKGMIRSFTDDVDNILVTAHNNWGTVKSVTKTAADVIGESVEATLTFSSGTEMNGLVKGELYEMLIWRDAQIAADDHVGDAHLISVEVKET